MISSQIDADRMDYLLRDAYFTGTEYGTFDLTRILRVIRPYEGGIAFSMSGMHAVEDYIVSRYQMYASVLPSCFRGMEVILSICFIAHTSCIKKMPAVLNSILNYFAIS